MFDINNPVDEAASALNAAIFLAKLRAKEASYNEPDSLSEAAMTITDLAQKFDRLVDAILLSVGASDCEWDFAPERAADDLCALIRSRIREILDERCAYRRELTHHKIKLEDAP